MRPLGAGGGSGFGVYPYNILEVDKSSLWCIGRWRGKGGSDGPRRVRPGKGLVGTQISRDFLKISGTGLAGATLLGTAGCGVFSGGGGGGGRWWWEQQVHRHQFGTHRQGSGLRATTDSVSTEILQNVMSHTGWIRTPGPSQIWRKAWT